MAQDQRTPGEHFQRLYDQAESSTARAFEEVVERDSFGALLARSTENVMAVVHLSAGALDLVIRNLRLAGRADVTRVARQLARTEDKLELVLQEVERLSQRLEAPAPTASNGRPGDARSVPQLRDAE
jgi:hypothetical protein